MYVLDIASDGFLEGNGLRLFSPIIDLLKPNGIETTSSAARIHYKWLVSAFLVMGFITTGFQLFGFALNCEPGYEKSKEIVDCFCATTIPYITIPNSSDTISNDSVKYVFLTNTCDKCNKTFFDSTTTTIFIKKNSNMPVTGVTNSYIKDSEPSNKVKLRFYMWYAFILYLVDFVDIVALAALALINGITASYIHYNTLCG